TPLFPSAYGDGLDHAQAGGVREVADRLVVGARHHPVPHRVRCGEHLREGAEQGEAAMSSASKSLGAGPSALPMKGQATAHSVVDASARSKWVSGAIVVAYALITITPLLWIFLTSFKTPTDSIAYPPKAIAEPSLEGYCNLFTIRSRHTPELGR